MDRHLIPRPATLGPIGNEVVRWSKSTAICNELKRPGELIHMHVKKLGKIGDSGGGQALGRQDGIVIGRPRSITTERLNRTLAT